MKRTLAMLLAIFMLAGMLTVGASAANVNPSGVCGDDLTWELDGNTLTISGTGPMYDYSEENPAPWAESKRIIIYVKIEDGVTSIGSYAFIGCERILRVYVPATVTAVGSKAFFQASGVVIFLGDAPFIAEDAFLETKKTVCYFFDWDPSVMQNYGGELTWIKGHLFLSFDESKCLYQLNEPIQRWDFTVFATYNSNVASIPYSPRDVEIGLYDNSTYGQKSVTVTVDGYEFVHNYFVTDGQNHLDLIQVELPGYLNYNGGTVSAQPVVTAGNITLRYITDYSCTYENNTGLSTNAQVTIAGRGIYEGFEETCTYAILKPDIADANVTVNNAAFMGVPVIPEVSVWLDGSRLNAGTDYTVVCENNVNVGTATVRIVGQGGYCGSVTKEFQIEMEDTTVALPGAYNGLATGTLNDQVYYSEGFLTPGTLIGKIDSARKHIAYYELYRVDGEEPVLIASQETDFAYASDTSFAYDFTSVYTDAAEAGGEVYMLAYSWVDSSNKVYSGICVLYIPAKVPDATSMVVEKLENDGDFRREYLTAYGPDGNVGDVEWTTSDSSVAAVKDGVVTLKVPGTVTITGQYSNLTASQVIQVTARPLSQCVFFRYDIQNGKAHISCDNIPMTEGTDYTCSVSVQADVAEVTLTGKGLFTGQLVRQFHSETGEALGEIHSFDSSCDETCNDCDYTRETEHDFAEQWSKDQTHHWHTCAACGEQVDYAEHSLSPEDSTLCTVCGTLYIPGDIDGNMSVDRDDVIQLLLHVSMPEAFPISAPADFNGDAAINRDDVVQLLLHVSMPDAFPL